MNTIKKYVNYNGFNLDNINLNTSNDLSNITNLNTSKYVNNNSDVENFDVDRMILNYIDSYKASYDVEKRINGLGELEELVNNPDFLTDDDKVKIKEVIKNENIGMTDIEIEDKLKKLMKACSDYSVDHGCGGYSLYIVLKEWFGMDISPQKFFGNILLNSLGADEWYRIMNRKYVENKGGPLTSVSVGKVLDYCGYGDRYKDLGEYKASDFQSGNSLNNLGKELLDHLKEGKPAIIMVGRNKKELDSEYFKSTFVLDEDKNISQLIYEKNLNSLDGKDKTWAKTSHYILLTGVDNNNNVKIIDSRNFDKDNPKFGHIRQSNYQDLLTYVSSNLKDGERFSSYASCTLIN